MKYIGKGSLSTFIKLFIILFMFSDMGYFNSPSHFIYAYMLIILYLTGIFSYIILNEMRKIFNTLEARNPFINDNVRSLKVMSFCAFTIAIVYVTKVFVINSIMTMLVVLVFFLAGLLALVLAEVFKKAVIYKEEIDLTV